MIIKHDKSYERGYFLSRNDVETNVLVLVKFATTNYCNIAVTKGFLLLFWIFCYDFTARQDAIFW